MSQRTSQLQDDRGRPLEPLTERTLRLEEENAESRRKLIRRLREGAKWAAQRDLLAQLVVLGVLLFGCFGCAFAAQIGGHIGQLVWFVIVIAAAVGASRAMTRRKIAAKMAASAVAEGFCGSCAQSLQGLPREDDGCICCSECGAAWKALRLTSPHWKEGTAHEQQERFGGFFGSFTIFPRPVVADGRGRFVRGTDGWVWRLPEPTTRELGPKALGPLRRDIRAVGIGPRIVSLVIVAGVFGFPGCWILIGGMGSRDNTWIIGLLLLCVGALLLWLVLVSPMGSPDRRAEVLVKHGVCGGCGQMLPRPHVPEQDGCVVCANCHAAWRVAPARPPTAPEVERSASEGDA